jgi:hypothetical protein
LIPADDAFTLEPGVERTVTLRHTDAGDTTGAGLYLSAINMTDRVRITTA